MAIVQVYLVAPTLIAWGLDRLLHTAAPEIALIGTAGTMHDALERIETSYPDVLVVDFDDEPDAGAVRALRERTHVKALVLTSTREAGVVQQLLDIGASVVHKRITPASFLRAVVDLAHTDTTMVDESESVPTWLPRAVHVERQPRRSHCEVPSLTLRERQTLAAIAADSTAPLKVIADHLCISEHTLRNRLTAIYAKFGVHGRLDLQAHVTGHGMASNSLNHALAL
ncbi:MAG TPA: LuxR C-terminal-related transcriptional regulator [Ramlibacter sp.]|nr:LuxR C-terminal-related transcriptional regulator [Ramlibacter sp.]